MNLALTGAESPSRCLDGDVASPQKQRRINQCIILETDSEAKITSRVILGIVILKTLNVYPILFPERTKLDYDLSKTGVKSDCSRRFTMAGVSKTRLTG